MINYATIGTDNIAASTIFWEAVLAPLGYKKFWEAEGYGAGLAIDGNKDNFGNIWIMRPYNGEKHVPANGTMIGFNAQTTEAIDKFHSAALANGGTCEGAPGFREQYGPNIYVAYIRDPFGNKVSAICLKSE
ncbi:MAG: VOC family protein [Caulobacterales bacterium]|nr:VOC family protein [Caulobacterales bacterium]MCA0372648.1 VOC family protein [Pseudomonadota bacterium]